MHTYMRCVALMLFMAQHFGKAVCSYLSSMNVLNLDDLAFHGISNVIMTDVDVFRVSMRDKTLGEGNGTLIV